MNEKLRRILRERVPPLTDLDVDIIIREFEATQEKAAQKKSKGGKH